MLESSPRIYRNAQFSNVQYCIRIRSRIVSVLYWLISPEYLYETGMLAFQKIQKFNLTLSVPPTTTQKEKQPERNKLQTGSQKGNLREFSGKLDRFSAVNTNGNAAAFLSSSLTILATIFVV